MNAIALPFEPETEEQAMARFAAAMLPHYDVLDQARAVAAGDFYSLPVSKRKHVFDFHDRLRMAANIETWTLGGKVRCSLHISFGYWPTDEYAVVPPDFLKERIRSLVELFSGGRRLLFSGPSPQGLPNFYFVI